LEGTSLAKKVIQIGRKCGELGQNFIHALIKRTPLDGQIFTKIIFCSTVLLYQFLSTSEKILLKVLVNFN
jgi:hypothetical protein